jgi:nitroreductase
VDSAEQQALHRILDAARWAVSADNGQPWKFYWRESRLFLVLDSDRVSSFFDRRHFAAYLGIGSLIENVCIAARDLGYEPDPHLFPTAEFGSEKVVAVVSFCQATPQPSTLCPAIYQRTTNRRPYRLDDIPADVQTALENSTGEFSGFRIMLVHDAAMKKRLAAMTARAESVRFNFSEKDVHADFFPCLRFTKQEAQKTGDGLWVRSLEGGLSGTAALWLLANPTFGAIASWLGAHRAFSQQSVYLLRRTPTVAFVIAPSNHAVPNEHEFLLAGRVCQRFWLTATVHKLACQPMAVLPLFFAQHASFGDDAFPRQSGKQIGSLRTEFNRTFNLAHNDQLMMIFRVGYAQAPSARSFRRPLPELLKYSDTSPIVGSHNR